MVQEYGNSHETFFPSLSASFCPVLRVQPFSMLGESIALYIMLSVQEVQQYLPVQQCE